MDDMAGKISELLSDPEGLEKIKSMAQMLFSGSNQESSAPAVEEKSQPAPDSSPLGGLLGGFSLPDGIDPIKIMGLISAFNNQRNDDRAGLLLALKPHLTVERRERVDKAVRLLKIAALIPVLKEQGILDIF